MVGFIWKVVDLLAGGLGIFVLILSAEFCPFQDFQYIVDPRLPLSLNYSEHPHSNIHLHGYCSQPVSVFLSFLSFSFTYIYIWIIYKTRVSWNFILSVSILSTGRVNFHEIHSHDVWILPQFVNSHLETRYIGCRYIKHVLLHVHEEEHMALISPYNQHLGKPHSI